MPLSYVTGPGMNWKNLTETRNKSITNFEAIDFQFPSFVRTKSATHAGEDVAIFARGPQAQLVSGSHEQSDIYYVMKEAFEFTEQPQDTNLNQVNNICDSIENTPAIKNGLNANLIIQVICVSIIVLLSILCLKQKNHIKELEEALYQEPISTEKNLQTIV